MEIFVKILRLYSTMKNKKILMNFISNNSLIDNVQDMLQQSQLVYLILSKENLINYI
jgi:hypothetical protein